MKIIPQERWTLFSHQVIHHGRSLCIARKPKCAECPIEPLCHAEDKTWSTVEMHKGAKAWLTPPCVPVVKTFQLPICDC